MSLSLKSLKSQSEKLLKNDLLTNLVIFITLALVVSYLSRRQYQALLILVLVSGVVFLIGKNLLYALVIGIILTNLLISSRVLRIREGNKGMEQVKKNNKINIFEKPSAKAFPQNRKPANKNNDDESSTTE